MLSGVYTEFRILPAYVEDEKVVAMTLRSNYHLVLGHKANGPTFHEVDPLYAHGSDGDGALTCKTTVVMFLPRYICQNHLS